MATEDDLQSALESAEDNATILVSADIALEKSITIPTGKKITLALAGHTITGSISDSAVKVEKMLLWIFLMELFLLPLDSLVYTMIKYGNNRESYCEERRRMQ